MEAYRGYVTLLVLVVVGLTGCAGAGVFTEDQITNGCRFEPDVADATTMECDFDERHTGVSELLERMTSFFLFNA